MTLGMWASTDIVLLCVFLQLIIKTPAGNLQIITPLLGRHNVYNILAAVATGLALKVPLKSIVAGIEAVEIIPGRSEVVDEGQDFSVIVDSADTPQVSVRRDGPTFTLCI